MILTDTPQQSRKSHKDSCNMTIQHCHRSMNQKEITWPDEASRMRYDTVATKNNKSRWPELFNYFLFDNTLMIDNIHWQYNPIFSSGICRLGFTTFYFKGILWMQPYTVSNIIWACILFQELSTEREFSVLPLIFNDSFLKINTEI